jgi:hypothetical protein
VTQRWRPWPDFESEELLRSEPPGVISLGVARPAKPVESELVTMLREDLAVANEQVERLSGKLQRMRDNCRLHVAELQRLRCLPGAETLAEQPPEGVVVLHRTSGILQVGTVTVPLTPDQIKAMIALLSTPGLRSSAAVEAAAGLGQSTRPGAVMRAQVSQMRRKLAAAGINMNHLVRSVTKSNGHGGYEALVQLGVVE